jgi:Mycothiol maleylpyruvate isomerase N-terminal domain
VASPGPDTDPPTLIEALETAARVLAAVVTATPPGVRAVIWRRPRVETRPAGDFAPRGALELILHGHDVCAGLGVPLAPPPEPCDRLRRHTSDWPHWATPGWRPLLLGGDPWADLLRSSGRADLDGADPVELRGA